MRGKFCVDPTLDLAVVDRALSAFLKGQPELRVVSPDLARALGDQRRAKREEREFEVLATT